jgi:uncharacterized membrane protein YgdD (TMEM256/DUF423 family)
MRLLFALSAANGFLAVLLGAFGAHGLRARFGGVPDAVKRLEWWQTASSYHLVHALAIGLAAVLAARTGNTLASVSGYAFTGGIVLFSGSLYLMTLTGVRALGAVTPLGGLSLLAGWACLFITALKA